MIRWPQGARNGRDFGLDAKCPKCGYVIIWGGAGHQNWVVSIFEEFHCNYEKWLSDWFQGIPVHGLPIIGRNQAQSKKLLCICFHQYFSNVPLSTGPGLFQWLATIWRMRCYFNWLLNASVLRRCVHKVIHIKKVE